MMSMLENARKGKCQVIQQFTDNQLVFVVVYEIKAEMLHNKVVGDYRLFKVQITILKEM